MEIVYGTDIQEIKHEVTALADDISRGMCEECDRCGREWITALLTSGEDRVMMRSDRLRLSGMLYRAALLDGNRVPVICAASKEPENGVYKTDRLRLAAYALMISEKYGDCGDSGVVVYACGWSFRRISIRKSDMTAVLSIRNRIEEIGTAMPDAKRGKWCHSCAYQSSCLTRVTFLDSILDSRGKRDSNGHDGYKTNK